MATLQDVRSLAREARGNQSSVNNCGMINSRIQVALEDSPDRGGLGINTQLTQCEIKGVHGGTDQHIFVYIPTGELEDVNSSIIVDGALDQFTDANLESGVGVTASLYSEDVGTPPIPEVVITKPGDSWYKYYGGAKKRM